MTHKYEIWLENSGWGTVSVFADSKEHIYHFPSRNFELYMNCGIAVHFIDRHAGIISTGGECPHVQWDGNMEWIVFESDIKLNWVVIIPVSPQNNILTQMVDD